MVQITRIYQNHEYNNSKHDLPEGLKAGNVKNTTIALAGLYALHVMAFYLQYEDKEDFLNSKHWYVIEGMGINSDNRTINTGVTFRGLESKIFTRLTYYNASGALI